MDDPNAQAPRPLDSAPSARAARTRAKQEQHRREQAFDRTVATIAAFLRRDHYATMPMDTPDSTDERTWLRTAARAAAKQLGVEIATHATREGSMMIAISADPTRLRDQIDEARARTALDTAFGHHPHRPDS